MKRVGIKRSRHLLPLAAILSIALTASAWTRSSPARLDPAQSWSPPSFIHPLGSGEGGVDLLALVANAELRAVALAIVVSCFGFIAGTPLGALAALRRGSFERGVDRACDLVQSFPTFLLALTVLAAVRNPTRVDLALVFSCTAWAPFTRLSLAQTRVLRDASFVEAAAALGATRLRVLTRHVVPNLLNVVAVQLGSTAAAVVVSEAALSFIGFGPRDGVSLGSVLDQGAVAMLRAPHVLVVGAVAVFATSTAMLMAGRALDSKR